MTDQEAESRCMLAIKFFIIIMMDSFETKSQQLCCFVLCQFIFSLQVLCTCVLIIVVIVIVIVVMYVVKEASPQLSTSTSASTLAGIMDITINSTAATQSRHGGLSVGS
jgi:uncharacterized membrane protein